jgi:hypothetical protein
MLGKSWIIINFHPLSGSRFYGLDRFFPVISTPFSARPTHHWNEFVLRPDPKREISMMRLPRLDRHPFACLGFKDSR